MSNSTLAGYTRITKNRTSPRNHKIDTITIHDPIPYPETAGIVVNVQNGKYYSYKGKVYLAKADMPNCVYPPDTPSLWQWEEVTGREA